MIPVLRRLRDPKIDVLRGVTLFRDLDRAHLKRIASLADMTDVEAGRHLVHRGARGLEFFVIVDGVATVSIDGHELATLRNGDFFGEMSILENGPRTADVIAQSDMRLLVLDRRSFASLLDQEPVVGGRILRAVSKRLGELESHWQAA